MVRFNGVIANGDGTPRTGVVGVMFSLYAEQQGGTALWTELQNVTLDASGQYTVLLGSQHADGVPVELFTTNEARWLGIQVEAAPEQPRVLLVSVPYALKAGDAETLGGKPLSAFLLNPNVDATSSGATTTTTGGVKTSSTSGVQTFTLDTNNSAGTAGFLARWSSGTTLGNSLIYDSGSAVGIGTATPGATVEIGGVVGEALRMTGTGSNPVAFRFSNSGNSAYFGVEGSTAGGYFPGSLPYATVYYGDQPFQTIIGGAARFTVAANGNVGIGTTTPGAKVEIGGVVGEALRMSGTGSNPVAFRFSNSGNSAYFGVESATGGGYFTGSLPYATVVYGDKPFQAIVAGAPRLTILPTGNVGIGTNSPSQALTVAGAIQSTSGGFVFPDNSTQASAGITGANSSAGINSAVANGILTLSGDTTYLQKRISGTCAAGTAVATVGADGSVTCQAVTGGTGGLALPATFTANSASGAFVVTQSNSTVLASNPTFVQAQTSIPAAVAGISSATSNTGVGVAGFSNSISAPAIVGWNGSTTGSNDSANGVLGLTDNPLGTAVSGEAQSTTGNTVGVRGKVKSPNGIAIEGDISGAGGLAGQFNGPVVISSSLTVNSIGAPGNCNTPPCNLVVNGGLFVNGSLSKSSGSFKIDHPLDPANKFLYHSFVESPDMMNVYNGVVALDASGRAWVQLPDYFEALNQDFRYQLTAIGAPGPNLYVAKEVSGNRFRIAGGKPHAKVSWQVTGIRHDAYAEANRIQVEVDKGAERGTYIHPELFGHPADASAKSSTPTVTPSAGENK